MFILSTYIDSDRWISGLEPLLYPTGISFYRPFSYLSRYFEPEQLADNISDNAQANTLLSSATWNDGFFGIRFKDGSVPEFQKLFIPLRRIRLTSAERSDSINLAFRLGAYVSPQFENGLRVLPRLDLTALVKDTAATKLFLQLQDAQRESAVAWKLSEAFPPQFWEAFENTLSVPAKDMVRHTFVLRVDDFAERGGTRLQPKAIDKSRSTYGYGLVEGDTYDLALSYFRLMRAQPGTSPIINRYCLTNSRQEIQCSRRSIQLVGNYRNETLWISPLTFTQAPITIDVEPCQSGKDETVLNVTDAKMVGIKLPVTIKSRDWPRTRVINLLLFIGFLVLTIVLLHSYFHASDPTQKALLVFIATCASLAVTALKDVITQRKR